MRIINKYKQSLRKRSNIIINRFFPNFLERKKFFFLKLCKKFYYLKNVDLLINLFYIYIVKFTRIFERLKKVACMNLRFLILVKVKINNIIIIFWKNIFFPTYHIILQKRKEKRILIISKYFFIYLIMIFIILRYFFLLFFFLSRNI